MVDAARIDFCSSGLSEFSTSTRLFISSYVKDLSKSGSGITLEDGDIFADEVAYASEDKKTVGVEIHSGRNRIVRRMFEHLGYTVQKLDRVYYAGLTKKNLKRGEWRFLTKDEVMRLKTGQYE